MLRRITILRSKSLEMAPLAPPARCGDLKRLRTVVALRVRSFLRITPKSGERTDVGSYMDAPLLPSIIFGSGLQVEIAAIHSASLDGTWPRALMEYAG